MLKSCMHILKPLFVTLVALVLASCQPSTPLLSTPELDQSELATLVMGTLQAMQSTDEATQPSATVAPDILPQSLYFLSERSGDTQVWRVGRDGLNLEQMSGGNQAVLDFDVNPSSGAVVTISDTRMRYLDNTGEVINTWKVEEKDLVEGLPAFGRQFSNPRISPDGRWLAYALNGVRLMDLESGESLLVLQNEWQPSASGQLIPQRLFFPESWSPDGSKLLVSVAYQEEGGLAFLNLENQELVELQASTIICCQATWDSGSDAIYVASPYLGLLDSGLWQYSAENGAETILIPSSGEDATVNLVGWPYSELGKLRFFYTQTAGIPEGDSPLFMMEARLTDADNPQALRGDAFQIAEVLWADDGELAVILPILQGESGPLVVAFADGRPIEVLIDDAWNLRWGP